MGDLSEFGGQHGIRNMIVGSSGLKSNSLLSREDLDYDADFGQLIEASYFSFDFHSVLRPHLFPTSFPPPIRDDQMDAVVARLECSRAAGLVKLTALLRLAGRFTLTSKQFKTLQKLFVSKSSHVQVTFFSRYFGLVVDHGLAVVDRREGVMSLLGSADARTVERRIGLAATFDLTSLDLVGPAKPHLARSLLLDVEDRSNSAVVAAIEMLQSLREEIRHTQSEGQPHRTPEVSGNRDPGGRVSVWISPCPRVPRRENHGGGGAAGSRRSVPHRGEMLALVPEDDAGRGG